MELLFMYLIAILIVFLIVVFITRWIFGIPKIIRNLETQTANLSMMRRMITVLAQKQGMTAEEINKIIETVEAENNI